VETEVNSHIYAGTGSVGSSTAVALPSLGRAVSALLIQAALANTAAIKVGSSSAQTIELEAGDTHRIPIKDVSKVYVIAASGTQTYNWEAVGS
jgi:hypothetical protein